MEMETVGETQFINQEISDSLQVPSEDQTSFHNNPSLQASNDLVSNKSQHLNAPDNTEEKLYLEEKYYGYDKKSLKSVRFLNASPNKNTQKIQERREINIPVSEQEVSRPKNTSKRRSIQVQIPVHFRSG